uniref:Venom peptide Os7a n=1 Tax=Oncocephalus sp. TaxID=2944721 RepID=A0AB38ZEU9_9HEMI
MKLLIFLLIAVICTTVVSAGRCLTIGNECGGSDLSCCPGSVCSVSITDRRRAYCVRM